MLPHRALLVTTPGSQHRADQCLHTTRAKSGRCPSLCAQWLALTSNHPNPLRLRVQLVILNQGLTAFFHLYQQTDLTVLLRATDPWWEVIVGSLWLTSAKQCWLVGGGGRRGL